METKPCGDILAYFFFLFFLLSRCHFFRLCVNYFESVGPISTCFRSGLVDVSLRVVSIHIAFPFFRFHTFLFEWLFSRVIRSGRRRRRRRHSMLF